MLKIIVELIGTCFYIGKVKYARSILTSLTACILSGLIVNVISWHICDHIDYFFIGSGMIVIILFIIGSWSNATYKRYYGQYGHQEFIFDKIIGQIFVCLFTLPILVMRSFGRSYLNTYELFNRLLGCNTHLLVQKLPKSIGYKFFILFYDNIIATTLVFFLPIVFFQFLIKVKPWPINWVNKKVKGWAGVMLDDIIVAIILIIIVYGVVICSEQ